MIKRGRLEVGLGRTVITVMMMPVLAAHQHHRVALVLGLFHMRGDVLDIQPDPAVVAAVRHRGMKRPAMMERCLSGLQRAENGLVLVDALDRLALQQDVGIILGRLMVEATVLVAAGKHAHATADIVRHRQR